MTNPDVTEFFVGTNLVHRVKSSHRLLKGDLINIAKQTYRVTAVSFALDHSADPWTTELVQAVFITRKRS